MLIRDFSEKKVCDYLDTGNYKKVLILFRHGLGDSIMFYGTCYKALIAKYPDISFTYSTHCGQEELFGMVDDNPDHYDIAFFFKFPCAEWDPGDETKSEKCARLEIGLPVPPKEDYKLPKSFHSPLVGLHFNSTCISKMNAPYDFAKRLWNQITDAGLIPIDTHMRHVHESEKSIVHDFEQSRRINNVPATIGKLIGLISTLRGFAGVPSGNLFCACATLPPSRILFLASEFHSTKLIHPDVLEIDMRKPYDAGIVREWIARLNSPED